MAQTADRPRRLGARRHRARDPDHRPGRRQLPVVRLPLPVRGVSRTSSARHFNDAFIAELDATTWTTAPLSTDPTISGLENDFALDPDGHPVTINSTGQSRMSPADAAGTPYGGATAPLRAKTAGHARVSTRSTSRSSIRAIRRLDSAGLRRRAARRATSQPRPACAARRPSGPALAITGPAPASPRARASRRSPARPATRPGDAPTVTVRIFNGADTVRRAGQTLTAPRTGTSWSVTPTTPLPAGTYTAQASQAAANGGTGVSPPVDLHRSCSRATATTTGSSTTRTPSTARCRRCPASPSTSASSRATSHQVPGRPGRRAPPARRRASCRSRARRTSRSARSSTPRKGRVALTSAADTGGKKTQTSDFYQGIFQVKQTVPKKKPKKPKALITDLVLKGAAAAVAVRAAEGRAGGGRQQEEGPQVGPRPALGQRQGQVPHLGQVQLGDGARHDLARPGSLRGHADQGHARHGPGGGLQAPQDGDRQGRAQLPRAGPARGEQGTGKK